MKRESPLIFYPRYWFETARKLHHLRKALENFKALEREIATAPDRYEFSDLATTAPNDTEFETLSLYHATRGGEEALARKRRGDAIRARTDERAAAMHPH